MDGTTVSIVCEQTMRALRSIVYVSTAAWDMGRSDLEDLLLRARQLNAEHAITGVLLYSSGNIMQCIEGPADAVLETYQRIRFSRRHHGLLELMNEPVTQRSFGDWQMALAETGASELLRLSTAQWTHAQARSAGATASSAGMELLKMFWSTSR